MLLDGGNMDMRSVQAFIGKEVWAVSSQEFARFQSAVKNRLMSFYAKSWNLKILVPV